MTGMVNWNFSEFHRVAEKLRDLGYPVINPAENFEGRTDLEYSVYIRKAISEVQEADALILLSGWADSLGAKMEVSIARALSIPAYEESMHPDETVADEPIFGSRLTWGRFPTAEESACLPGCNANGPVCDSFRSMAVCTEWIPVGAVFRCLDCKHLEPEHACADCSDCGRSDGGCDRVVEQKFPERFNEDGTVKDAPPPYGVPAGPSQLPPRAEILHEAETLVTGDRNVSYGSPVEDFGRTAGMLTSLGYRRILPDDGTVTDLVPSDVAIFVAAVKLSRLMSSREKRDNWTDLAGYAACGAECAISEGESS
jgi:hypothetical protein